MIHALIIATMLTPGQTVDLTTLKGNWCSVEADLTSFNQVQVFGNVLHFSLWNVRDGVACPKQRLFVVRDAGGNHRGWHFYEDGSRGESRWRPIDRGWEARETILTSTGTRLTTSRVELDVAAGTWTYRRGTGPTGIVKKYEKVAWGDSPMVAPSQGVHPQQLGVLSPLVGRWEFTGEELPDKRFETTEWSPWGFWILKRRFVIGWTASEGERDSVSVTGWDVSDKAVKTWVLRTDGGNEVHTLSLSSTSGRWETRFTGADPEGTSVHGSGCYTVRLTDHPSKLHLSYEETRAVNGEQPVHWRVFSTRPRLMRSDFAGPAAGREVLVTGSVHSRGIDSYWLYLPKAHDPQRKWPLIVYLHGSSRVGGQPVDVRHLGPVGYASRQIDSADSLSRLVSEQFIIVNPHLTADIFRARNWSSESKALDLMIDSLVKRYGADPDRIYVTGLSRGGHGTWRFSSRSNQNVAAIVPICGAPDMENLEQIKDLPVWVLHNQGDPVVKYEYSKKAVDELEKHSGEEFLKLGDAAPAGDEYLSHQRIFTTFERAGHDPSADVYSQPQIYHWLLKQRR